MSKYFRWAELPARTDIYTYGGTTRWGNHDLYPIAKKERTYGWMGFYSYYLVSGISTTGYSIGSAYLASGLSAGETIGAVFVGCIFAALNASLGVQVGLDKNLGFTMSTRATYGLYGNLLPLFTTLLGNLVFAGLQAFYGAQALSLLIGAVIPQYKDLTNTLSADAGGITTRELISFFIYWILFIPLVWFVPMPKLKNMLYPSVVATAASLFGLLGWTISNNGGTVGALVVGVPTDTYNKAFLFLQCVSSTAAVWGGSGDRLSDWSRYSKNKWAPYPALFTALPISLTLFAGVGTLTTSAYYNATGEVQWNPLVMLLAIQEQYYTPACRAATFFAGVGILSNLLYINIVQNTLSFGMDIAGVAPRYLDMKRGSMIVVIVGIACNPWRLLSQALVFTEVFAVFAVFATASVAIINTDYWIIRRRKWKIPDLYQGNGIYWFWHGINLRSIATWWICIVPGVVGFAWNFNTDFAYVGPAYRIYQLSFFVGYPIAVCTYIVINKFFPVEGLGIAEELDEEPLDGEVIDSSSNLEEKDIGIVETKPSKALDM